MGTERSRARSGQTNWVPANGRDEAPTVKADLANSGTVFGARLAGLATDLRVGADRPARAPVWNGNGLLHPVVPPFHAAGAVSPRPSK